MRDLDTPTSLLIAFPARGGTGVRGPVPICVIRSWAGGCLLPPAWPKSGFLCVGYIDVAKGRHGSRRVLRKLSHQSRIILSKE